MIGKRGLSGFFYIRVSQGARTGINKPEFPLYSSFRKLILPGTFEYTLGYLIDHELDLSMLDARHHLSMQDLTGVSQLEPVAATIARAAS